MEEKRRHVRRQEKRRWPAPNREPPTTTGFDPNDSDSGDEKDEYKEEYSAREIAERVANAFDGTATMASSARLIPLRLMDLETGELACRDQDLAEGRQPRFGSVAFLLMVRTRLEHTTTIDQLRSKFNTFFGVSASAARDPIRREALQ